jgi:type I restriction enzyme S subunit
MDGHGVSDVELPSGWRWERLGALGTWTGGGTPSKGNDAFWTNGTIPWISPKDMKSDFVGEVGDKITSEAVVASAAKLIPAGSVLCVMRSGILEHTFPVAISERDVTVNQDLRALTPNGEILPRYLMFYLRASNGHILHTCRKDGTTVASIEFDRLDRLQIPVAPLEQQHRIVARIEELFGEIEAGEQELAAAKADLQRYRRAVLKAAVTGELTRDWREQNPPNETGADLLARILKERRARWEEAERAKFAAKGQTPKNDAWRSRYPEPVAPNTDDLPELPSGWIWAAMDQLTAFLTSGSRGWAEHYAESGATFVRAQNIKTDRLVLDDIAHVAPPVGAEGARTRIELADILITITGANVTKSALVEDEIGEAYVSQHVALLRLVDTALASYVHRYLLDENTGRKQLLASAYGAGKPGLNLDQIRELRIPLPPAPERPAIVEIVDQGLEAWSDTLAVLHNQGVEVSRLRQSILAAAFSGKLIAEAAPTAIKAKPRHVA